jgi:DnaJ-domain-containing protein 1
LMYLVRQTALSSLHWPQIRTLKAFAAADPDRLIDHDKGDAECSERAESGACEYSAESAETREWFTVLGVSPSATIDEVKQAYKLLLKQNHPDRVYNMSAAFRRLAEAETKKLNIAYEQALTCLRDDDWNLQEVSRAA